MDKNNCLVKVYELRNPLDDLKVPKYIGITTQSLDRRLYNHLSKNKLKSKNKKNSWIKNLLTNNLSPSIHLIEEVYGWDYAYEVEKYWIKEFKEQGIELLNMTDGGKGSIGTTHPQEVKDKISLACRGENHWMYGKKRPISPKYGTKASDETKIKMSITRKGKTTCRKGTKHSEETKQKMKDAWENKPYFICPNCGYTSQASHLKRFHFDNCKKYIQILNNE